MIWPFNSRRKVDDRRERDILRDLRVLESQHALLEAATQTADAANVVTNSLRARLQDSISQFENTARILNDALVICDLEGKVQAFNPAAERMFNLPARDARDAFVGDLLEWGDTALTDIEYVWELLSRLEKEDDDGATLKGVASNGRTFPIDVNHTRLDRSDNSAIVLLVIRDITPCADIKVSLKSYRSIFDSAFDCILVIDNDDIVAANPVASEFFGYSAEELLSKRLDDLIVTGRHDLSKAFSTGDDAVDLKGKIADHDGHQMEVTFTTTTIWWNGRPAALVTIKDTTSVYVRAPQIENLICCFNDKFKITFVNAAFASFYGLGRDKLVGSDIRALQPENDRSAFLMHLNGLTPQTPSRRMQLRTRDHDGAICTQVWTDNATFDDDGVEYQRIGHVTRD
jgi:PAS domain S-box-containing protein